MSEYFHFDCDDTAIRYHITRVLLKKGWEKNEENPSFSDANLILNDEISTHFEYKHLLWLLLQNIQPAFLPLSYPINDANFKTVLSQVVLDHYMVNGQYQKQLDRLMWLLKPSTLNNGDEIKIFRNIEDVQAHYLRHDRLGGEQVLQQYIYPDLFQGKKYTFRIFVALTNYAGVFIYHDGYINVSAVPFDLAQPEALRKMHITNYVLDGELANITQHLASEVKNFALIHQQMKEIVAKTVKKLIKKFPRYLKPQPLKVVELFGYDFMLDESKKLWLLEINQGPDCPMIADHALNESLWYPFWDDVVENFVCPIGRGDSHILPNPHSFQQVLGPKQCYSRLRDWLG